MLPCRCVRRRNRGGRGYWLRVPDSPRLVCCPPAGVRLTKRPAIVRLLEFRAGRFVAEFRRVGLGPERRRDGECDWPAGMSSRLEDRRDVRVGGEVLES